MAVAVDPNGTTMTFRLPTRDVNGDFAMPLTFDGVVRQFTLQGDRLVLTEAGVPRVIATGLVRQNEGQAWSTTTNRIFTAGTGGITRSIVVRFVTRREQTYQKRVTSAARETIYLRNIPELIR
jgi:hypothetical protein